MTLRRNVAWALAGNGGYAVCQWALLVAIAKLGTANDVGRFALALALTGPPMMFANLHLRAVQATDAAGAAPFGAYLGLRLLTTTVALLAIGGVTLGAGAANDRLTLVAMVAATKAVESICDVLYGRLQRDEQQRRIALSMLVRGASSVLAIVGTLAAGGTLVTALAVLVGAWLLCLLLVDLPSVRARASVWPEFRIAFLRPLFWTAFPMGAVMALGSLTTNVPRYALEASAGTVALGHFAAIVYLFVAAMQPMLAVGAAVSPRLAQLYRCDLAAYRRLVRRTLQIAVALGLCVTAGVLAAGPQLLALAYAPDYAVHGRAFGWTAVATAIGFVASALGYAATAARRFHAQLLTAILALLTCAIASALFVPHHGLVGAAWAMCCTEVVRAGCGLAIYAQAVGAHALVAPAAGVPAGAMRPTLARPALAVEVANVG